MFVNAKRNGVLAVMRLTAVGPEGRWGVVLIGPANGKRRMT